MPLVAIVILNFNGREYLEKFLPSVLASVYENKKIVVADNASQDDSVSWLRQYFPSVEIILLDKNFGFAEGYNQALKQVSADYYILLNSDVEVTPHWIHPIITLMENDKTIGACQPKILSYKEKSKFEYAGAGGGWIDHLGYPFARGRVFETIENDLSQYNDIIDVFWASGAAMFIRPEVYHQLNGFDGSFFAHQEEIDLCWRIQLAGFKISYCGTSEVYHVGGGTLPKGHRKTYLNFRNNLVMLSKNLPIRIKWWLLPYRMLLDGIFAIKCLFAGDTNSFKALLQAHFSVWKYWFSKKPLYALHRKSLVSLHGVSKKSIVWEYFVRKNKFFKEII